MAQETREDLHIEEVWSQWRTKEYLGAGSFGRVYKITREEFGHTYESALKVIRIPSNDSEVRSVLNDGYDEKSAVQYFYSMVEDIVKEFKLMSTLRGNSNIVSYEDHAIIEHKDGIGWDVYMRMELLTSLFDYWRANKATVNDVVRLGIDICQALESCWKHNIIHRDIKPENIFVSDEGNYKLGDFGISRQMEKTVSGLSKKGTYTYMAPEVYRGEDYDETVDIYSLGIVLYRYLNNNRTPFLPLTAEVIGLDGRDHANRRRFNGEELPPPCNADGELSEVVLKACAYQPGARYQNPTDLKQALQKVQQRLEVSEEGAKPIFMPGDVQEKSSKGLTLPDREKEDMEDTVGLITKRSIKKEDLFFQSDDIDRTIGMLPGQKIQIELVQAEQEQKQEILEQEMPVKEPPKQETAHEELSGKEQWKKKMPLLVAAAVVALVIATVGVNRAGMANGPVVEEMDVSEDMEIVMAMVPDIKGKTYEEAQKLLEEKGISIEKDKENYSDTVKKGLVISQSVKAGEEVGQGTKVSVVISKGKKQAKKVPVPELVGKTQQEALDELSALHLTGSLEAAYSDEVEAGCVISQSIAEGEKVDKNTEVHLVISQGAEPETSGGSSSGNSGSSSGSGGTSSGSTSQSAAPAPAPAEPTPAPAEPEPTPVPAEPVEQPAVPQEPDEGEDINDWDSVN